MISTTIKYNNSVIGTISNNQSAKLTTGGKLIPSDFEIINTNTSIYGGTIHVLPVVETGGVLFTVQNYYINQSDTELEVQ